MKRRLLLPLLLLPPLLLLLPESLRSFKAQNTRRKLNENRILLTAKGFMRLILSFKLSLLLQG